MSNKMKFGGNQGGFTSLLKDGYKHMSGLEEAMMRNIEACKGLAAITRTSLGPNGMNKLVVNHLEKIFVTSDAATIVQELEIAHPAAKMLTIAAKMQETECGDGTNLVITLAGELLTQAEGLLRLGVHPAEIIEGYSRASAFMLKELETLGCYTIADPRNISDLAGILRPVIAAKQGGYEEILSQLVAEAIHGVMPHPPRSPSVNVDNVRVAKILGGAISDSQIVNGMVILRDSEGTIKHVEKAKVAVFSCGIESSSTETKGTVVIKSANELLQYSKGEEAALEDIISGIASTGAKVLVVGGAISELAMHYVEKFGMLVVKVPSKFELRRLCRSVGATALVRLGPPLPEELGFADEVSVQELSSKLVTVFRQESEDSAVSTIVLRGSTMNTLDDLERAIDDAVNVAKLVCKDGRFVAGAGACEIELAMKLKNLAASTPGLEQYAINVFGESLEVVARILAENSGYNASDVVSALYAAHTAGNTHYGVNIEQDIESNILATQSDNASQNAGTSTSDQSDLSSHVLNAKARGILDSLAVKSSALRLAADVALTVLRVDQIIMSKQAGGPKPRAPGPQDADD
jgi:T-complex protein 1 subunit theta